MRALVHGLNRGVCDTLQDIDAGMAALARAAPSINVAVQRRRLLDGITTAVGDVRKLVESVSSATQQQAQGFDQVATAIQQMEKVTQTNAATAEESAACLLYTSPSPRDRTRSRMPSSA